jgi:hypothetical protein
LKRYGLERLAGWLSIHVIADSSIEEIMLDLYDQPEFKEVFPEIEARRKRAAETGLNLQPITPEDILSYRVEARQLMRSYGLSPSFADNNTALSGLIVNDVSMAELDFRLQTASQRVANAPPQVRSIFTELFGAGGDDALFSMFVDPDIATTVLEDRVSQAEVGGAARRFGYDLGRGTLEEVADYRPSYDQALQAFAAIRSEDNLFQETILEEGVDLQAEEEGVRAAFAIDADAAEAIERRAEQRTAETGGGAGGLQEQRGSTGLGGAGRL